MKILLELFRVLAITAILGTAGGLMLTRIYSGSPDTEPYRWLGGVAVLVLIFVLYRNKLQFSGWYRGKERRKLRPSVSIPLASASVLLMILPFVLADFSN